MHGKFKIIPALLLGIVVVLVMAGSGLAYTFYTDAGVISLTGKIYSQASWRTEDSGSFTFTAPETDSGDFIQHRNLLKLEFKDEFNDYLTLFLSGRFIYDGLDDYGADKFDQFIDPNEAYDADLREAYLDITYEQIFIRLGRQNLSWGESDIFRLLDGINPLDNTFGLFFEDQDERREPIDMARLDIDFGKVGPIHSFTFEGFVASGRKQTPVADPGTPYAIPAAALPMPLHIEKPDHDRLRGGFRFLGLTKGVSWSLGHYWSYPDNPMPVFQYRQPNNPFSAYAEMNFKRQATTGGSFTFFTGFDATQTVVRGELAYTWDEGVFIPSISMPFNIIFVPGPIAIPVPGDIEEAGVFKWVLGFDNNIFLRQLNMRNSFFVSLQAFGRHIVSDWRDDISVPASIFPNPLDFVEEEKNSYMFTLLTNTKYLDGNLTPEIAMAYDTQGVWYIQPSLKYRWKKWEPMLRYSKISGNFYNIGFFEDRDQISFRLTYYFE